MTIFIDIDGVLADFISGVAELYDDGEKGTFGPKCPQSYNGLHEVFGDDVWGRIEREGPGFWIGLKPYPWTEEWIEIIKNNDDIIIVTSPTLSGYSAKGKMGWIQRYLGVYFRRYIIAPSGLRHQLYNYGDWLIDDNDDNINAWAAHEGENVLWPMPWNRLNRLPSAANIRSVTTLLKRGL